MKLIFTVTENFNQKPLLVFLKKSGVSSTYIKKVKNTPHGILVNGERKHTNFLLTTGDSVLLPLLPEQEQLSAIAEDIPFEVVYKSDYALVCEKPPFQTIHSTMNHKSGTLANAFSNYIQAQPVITQFRPIYRLDRNTSGLVLLAMNSLSAPFLAASAKKTYIAVVGGRLCGEGEIDAPIGLEHDSIVKHCVCETGKHAKTFYNAVWTNGEYSLVKLRLETGRTHQIRVHMQHIGHPLLGDDLYGGDCSKINRHALHCNTLTFVQPDNTEVFLESELPLDMKNLLPKDSEALYKAR